MACCRVQSSGTLSASSSASIGCTDQLRPRHERPPLGRDPPDPAAGVVAARVAEIDLAVLDDRVVPVGDVDRAVGPHLDVDRPEGDVRGLDQLGLLAARRSPRRRR